MEELLFNPELRPGSDEILWPALFDDDISWQKALHYVARDAKLIVDVGCNAGFTTGCFATSFPEATVIGIDMTPDSVERARYNCRQFGDRVQIVEAAVGYPRKTLAQLRPTFSPQDSIVFTSPDRDSLPVQVRSLDDVLKPWSDLEIDYLKMDIEGAEREIIPPGGDWVARTKLILVECHDHGYTWKDAERDLEKLGFERIEGTLARRPS